MQYGSRDIVPCGCRAEPAILTARRSNAENISRPFWLEAAPCPCLSFVSLLPPLMAGGSSPCLPFRLSQASPYGKGRWCAAPEGIRKPENDVGREETTAFSLQIENRADNPSVMLRMTAPFAQGSHGVGAAMRPSPCLPFWKGEVVRSLHPHASPYGKER